MIGDYAFSIEAAGGMWDVYHIQAPKGAGLIAFRLTHPPSAEHPVGKWEIGYMGPVVEPAKVAEALEKGTR